MKFFDDRELPPYLSLALEGNDDNSTKKSLDGANGPSNGEADAAAGSVLQRVSSFNLFPPTPLPPRPLVSKDQDSQKTVPKTLSDVIPTWRLKDRMKTVGVGLVMALNVGTDPPDITKPHPCAKLQCWMDPSSISRAKAKEKIGERLEAQYAKWQQQRAAKPLKYRRALDPTVEDVRALCLGLRRQARNERILLHYNGHGVPRPTANGEIWVFDRNHTQYIPLNVTDLRQWMGKPSIVVLDCSSAGILMPFLTAPLEPNDSSSTHLPNQTSVRDDMETAASQWVRDTIVLCPTSDKEWLPMHPDYPADVFTSCLTTPIKMALRWFVRRNPQSMHGLNPDAVDEIPGKANDRKTPLGELNWIFTAVTDSIAWNILPKPLFQRLFRQDLLVASMFRNFLLADRILRSLNCSPQSYPPLPPGVCDHPLWHSWDLACETCLCGLMRDNILGNHVLQKMQPDSDTGGDENAQSSATQLPQKSVMMGTHVTTSPGLSVANGPGSPFFSEQLTAFEIWLEFASLRKSPGIDCPLESPEQLPVVLQVLLSQAHRVRALALLRQFLDLGPWAVNLALSLGIFPYVMKLLQSPEYKQNLVEIWAKILKFDPSCQVDLVKDGALPHFVNHLRWGLNEATMHLPADADEAAEQRTMAAFILSETCCGYSQGQTECMHKNLHGTCSALLSSIESYEDQNLDPNNETDNNALLEESFPRKFRSWLCLCLGSLMNDNSGTQNEVIASGIHLRLIARLQDDSPDVRASACVALTSLLDHTQTLGATQPLGTKQTLSPEQQNSVTLNRSNNPNPIVQTTTRLIPQQPALTPPQISTATGFPGRLQPAFHTGNSGVPWQSQQLPSRLMQNIVQHSPTVSSGASLGITNTSPLPSSQRNLTTSNPLTPREAEDTATLSIRNRYTVFEDKRRLDLDLLLIGAILNVAEDASSIVRYEVLVVFGIMIEKYLPAFLAASEEMSRGDSESMSGEPKERTTLNPGDEPKVQFPFPECLDSESIDTYRHVWSKLRNCQHKDPHPIVSKAANSIVSYVHENILRVKMSSQSIEPGVLGDSGIKTIPSRDGSASTSAHNLLKLQSPQATRNTTSPPKTDDRVARALPPQSDQFPLRRISSEFGVSFPTPVAGATNQDSSSSTSTEKRKEQCIMKYTLPKSEFFKWKRDSFFSESNEDGEDQDPLSPHGALKAYIWRRNNNAEEESLKIAQHYACLAPKTRKTKEELQDSILLENEQSAILSAEEKLAQKKKKLELKQTGLMKIEGSEFISLLQFHPYEDIVVVYDDQDGITGWDSNRGSKEFTIRNRNPKQSRFTSSCWIGAQSNSLLVAGCDDGSVRIWGGLPFPRAGGNSSVSLVSAFYAMPNLSPDVNKSGLILDWQQHSGQLIAAGNSEIIRIWDINSERCSHELKTDSDACITTLTTPWSSEIQNVATGISDSGIGPNLLVAGLSDGSIKVFDKRMGSPVIETGITTSISGRGRRRRLMHYREHGSWVVSTAFTQYNGRPEIVSGSVLGDVRIFDLRTSSSMQTYTVQRSKMTAMCVHNKIPMIATGSHARFIKIMTLDGDSIQVIRHAQMNQGRRIGPVSCVTFHPRHPLLAVGGRDNFVHLFRPRDPIVD